MFEYDTKGAKPSEGFVLPKAWYGVEIVEFISQAGDRWPREGVSKENKYPKVDLCLEVFDGQYKGKKLFYTVTFVPGDKDGAGMALHFLKTIGMPYEGKISPNCEDWIGKKLLVYAVPEEYNGKVNPKVSQIKPLGADQASVDAIKQAEKNNDVPY